MAMTDPVGFLNRRGPTCPLIGGFTSNAACLRDDCAFWRNGVRQDCMWNSLVNYTYRIAWSIAVIAVSSVVASVTLIIWMLR